MTRQASSLGGSPLAGVTVCLTRPPGSNESLRQLAVAAGADVVEMPLIEIQSVAPNGVVEILRRLSEYDGVIVTSGNAAAIAANFAVKAGITLQELTPWYAIGRATASVVARQALPAVQLCSESGEAFARNLGQQLGSQRARMLFLRGAQARSVVPQMLRDAGHTVDEVVCYETVPAMVPDERWAELQDVKAVFMPLFSPSAAHSLALQRVQAADIHLYVFAIGRTTAAACKACGLDAAAVAAQPTPDSMLDAMMELWHQVTT